MALPDLMNEFFVVICSIEIAYLVKYCQTLIIDRWEQIWNLDFISATMNSTWYLTRYLDGIEEKTGNREIDDSYI